MASTRTWVIVNGARVRGLRRQDLCCPSVQNVAGRPRHGLLAVHPCIVSDQGVSVADHERQEPAISGYDMRYDDPRMNPIAFLPADPPGSISYGGVVDHVPLPGEPSGFIHDDGSVYARPDPSEFPEAAAC